jgi:beta-phosphoglucomutase-like phosphatase (HAD superfamily)
MCEKCDEIDKKIDHYRVMASRITDQPLLDGIKELIERMQTQKAALHPGSPRARSNSLTFQK